MHPDFDHLVAQQIDRLSHLPPARIEADTIAKRRQWFEQRFPRDGRPPWGPRPLPRDAFATLFFDYMGLSVSDLDIVHDDDTEIIWLSRNACPTLAACVQLGLDTRKVCRQVYERSTQAFVSLIDPQIRFLRDYKAIRPFAAHCRERLVRVDFAAMMRLAVAQAKLSRQTGNKGYGAVVALGNQILAQAHDTAISERDPSLHAEVNAIRQAVRVLGDDNLSGAVLVSSCEPCPMCASLAVWANIGAMVFGASITGTAARGRGRILIPAREVVERSLVPIEVIGGVLEEECLALY
jgi:tRNA(Arg) A34 adenosine deaminase TadA